MDRGTVVLACPGSGGTRDRLVANLLVFDLLHAAKGRADLAPERRRPFFVFLDEVQTYDGASSGNLAALLEQTAKYVRGRPDERGLARVPALPFLLSPADGLPGGDVV